MSQEMLISLVMGLSFLLVIVLLWIGLNLKISDPSHNHKYPPIDGDLIIDTKDPHKDVLRFELYYDPEILLDEACKKEFVHFRIIRNDKKEI